MSRAPPSGFRLYFSRLVRVHEGLSARLYIPRSLGRLPSCCWTRVRGNTGGERPTIFYNLRKNLRRISSSFFSRSSLPITFLSSLLPVSLLPTTPSPLLPLRCSVVLLLSCALLRSCSLLKRVEDNGREHNANAPEPINFGTGQNTKF